MDSRIVAVGCFDINFAEIASLIVVQLQIVATVDVVGHQWSHSRHISQVTNQQPFVPSHIGFMIFDQILRQLDCNSLNELAIHVDLSIVLNNGDLLGGDVVVRKIDMIGCYSMPVEQSLSTVPEVGLSYSLVNQFIIVEDEGSNHAETVGWWDENIDLLLFGSIS